MDIEIGDFYLVTTKNGDEYDGQITGLSETTLTIEHWNEVKERTDETDIKLSDIKLLEGFNDSQTTNKETQCKHQAASASRPLHAVKLYS